MGLLKHILSDISICSHFTTKVCRAWLGSLPVCCPCCPHYHLQLPFTFLGKMGDDFESDTSEFLAELLGQDPAEVYLRRLLARDRPLPPLPSGTGRDVLTEMVVSHYSSSTPLASGRHTRTGFGQVLLPMARQSGSGLATGMAASRASSSAAPAPAASETLLVARATVSPIAPSSSAVLVPSVPTTSFQSRWAGVARAPARSRSPPLGAEFVYTSARGLTSAFDCRALPVPRQDEIVNSGLRLHPRTFSSLTWLDLTRKGTMALHFRWFLKRRESNMCSFVGCGLVLESS